MQPHLVPKNDMSQAFPSLPLGTSTFSTLRASNEIYVDKTALIHSLAATGRGKIFLARPRRFGKSLLVSTFESLFANGLRDFKGLCIEQTWQDSLYPVIRLDFSQIKALSEQEQFSDALKNYLYESFSHLGFAYDPSRTSFFAQLDSWLRQQGPNSIVLLIDEYDAPLTERLGDTTAFNAVRDMLTQFFAILKSNEGCLRFFFMTGITKFSNTSIFSAFNNLEDISLDPLYGTLLGYTEEEIVDNFGIYLDSSAQALSLSGDELLSQLRIHYNGFCFDEQASTSVYCPWSVLNFLKRPTRGFKNYWYESGGKPSVLMSYLNSHSLTDPVQYNRPIDLSLDDLSAARTYADISEVSLLTQTGYLTIKNKISARYVQVGFPNQEVSLSMGRLYADVLLGNSDKSQIGITRLAQTLAVGNLDEIVSIVNQAFNAMDYHRFSVRDEAFCRSYLQILLIGADLEPVVEMHSALGRSDIEVDAQDRHWVFEIKFAKTQSEIPTLLDEGITQIRDRRYGKSTHAPVLKRAVLVFDQSSRQFAA